METVLNLNIRFSTFVLLFLSNCNLLFCQELDLDFGDEGIALVDVNGAKEFLRDFKLLDNGNFLITGKLNDVNDDDDINNFVLVSASPDGSLNTDFGDNGVVITSFGTYSDSRHLCIQNDNKILLGGNVTNIDGVTTTKGTGLVRYFPDGTLDLEFAQDGHFFHTIGSAGSEIHVVEQLPDGKIIIGGSTITFDDDFLLLRLNMDGSLDSTFNQTGIVQNDFGEYEYIRDLEVLSDGSILACGYKEDLYGSFSHSLLVKYLPNGDLDMDFGDNGVIYFFNDEEYAAKFGVFVGEDNKIYTGGHMLYQGGQKCFVNRYWEDGELDVNFGNNGSAIIAEIPYSSLLEEIYVLPNGSIFACGNVYTGEDWDMTAFKLRPNGSLDATFGENGWIIYDHLGHWDYCSSIVLDSDNAVILGGTFYVDESNSDFMLMKFMGDGTTSLLKDRKQVNFQTNLYPNLVNNESLQLALDLDEASYIGLKLLDSHGRLIRYLKEEGQFNSGHHQIDLTHLVSSLQSGQYFIEISKGEESVIEKFIKI